MSPGDPSALVHAKLRAAEEKKIRAGTANTADLDILPLSERSVLVGKRSAHERLISDLAALFRLLDL